MDIAKALETIRTELGPRPEDAGVIVNRTFTREALEAVIEAAGSFSEGASARDAALHERDLLWRSRVDARDKSLFETGKRLQAVEAYAELARDALDHLLHGAVQVLDHIQPDGDEMGLVYIPGNELDALKYGIEKARAALAQRSHEIRHQHEGVAELVDASGLNPDNAAGSTPAPLTTDSTDLTGDSKRNSKFADFIRNAEGEERAAVFERVIDKSIEAQRSHAVGHSSVDCIWPWCPCDSGPCKTSEAGEETPRTDALIESLATQTPVHKAIGLMGFARTLERELRERHSQVHQQGETLKEYATACRRFHGAVQALSVDSPQELLREGLAVAEDLATKTDVYLGIGEAQSRRAAWEARVKEFLTHE